jgi:hypothetical protein
VIVIAKDMVGLAKAVVGTYAEADVIEVLRNGKRSLAVLEGDLWIASNPGVN